MQAYWITDRQTGEATLVDGDTLERLLEVELVQVEHYGKTDDVYENLKWKDCA